MPFRLIASDLDGTLLRSDESVSARTKDLLHRVSTHASFVIATGRPPRWTYPIAEAVALPGVAICSNGAVTIDTETQAVVDSQQLTPEVALEIVRSIRTVLPDVQFAVDSLDGFGHEDGYASMFNLPNNLRVAKIEELLDRPSLKVLFRHMEMSEETLVQVVAAIGDRGSVTYGSSGTVTGRTLIEIMAPGVTKASALQRLCDARGLAASQVVAFGDMPNDIEMLEWAGHGVAMANAHHGALAIANEVTHSNDEDGVAHVLERVFKDSLSL